MGIGKNALRFTAAAAAALTLAACGERFEENETGFRIGGDGAVREDITGPDWICFVFCDPLARSIKYKTFTDTFTISTNEGAAAQGEGGAQVSQARPLLLRTQDDKFVDNISIAISYEVVAEAPTEYKRRLRSEFRAESSDVNENMLSIRDDIQIEAIQPIVDAIRGADALSIQDQGDEIGAIIAVALQANINRRLGVPEGEVSPVRIRAVRIAGVSFDPETEEVLREVSLAAERGRIAGVARLQAEGQAASARAQAGVSVGIADRLRGHVPEGQLSTAMCLDMVRQNILPPTTNCFPGLVTR
ncbi:MAG: hypothetical protein GC136_04550 [Alphaproteobacteria bacterium]|nr:hypothetical protein [Alphaproteobacteria bacterium]